MRNIDTVPALLASEEHVMNRGAVDLVGGKNLAKLNSVGRQIMNNNPQRYNKPSGIDQSVPPRLGAKFDQGNGVHGNMPGLAGVVKNGNSYSQAPGFIPSNTVRTPTGIYPQRYQEGTTLPEGVRPLRQPGLIDSIMNMMRAQDEPQRQQVNTTVSAPTLEQARQNAMMQPASMPVKKYAYGTDENGVEDYPAIAGLPSLPNASKVKQELQNFFALDPNTADMRLPSSKQTNQQPGFFDEAKRSVGNVLSDYANQFSGQQPISPQQPVIAKPQGLPKPTQDIGLGNIDMNKVPSRISDAGLPYNAVGNTVNFTNANGTGQGSISERMPVNGGLGARMNDGKGSFSVMKLESPYGPGGRSQEIAPQQANYQPEQSEDYSGYISDLMTKLDMNRPDGKFDSLGTLIGKKNQNRQVQGQIDALSGLQNQGNQNAINRDRLNADVGFDNAKLGLNQAQFNQGVKQQDFNNTLGLADIGIKQMSAQANTKRDAEKFNLEKIKAAPQVHQSQMLEALSAAIGQGKMDDPKVQQIARIYQMAFGKNPMDDLLATVQQQ